MVQDLMRSGNAAAAVLGFAVLDALPASTAVLAADGTIVCVNEAWHSLAQSNGRSGVYERGANYLALCDQAAAEGDEALAAIVEGVRSVLAGACSSFRLEYPYHTEAEHHWLLCTARPLPDGGLVVQHLPITDLKRMEQRLQRERQVAAEAHEALCEAVESMSEGFALYDSNERLLFCNDHYEGFCKPIAQLIRSGVSFRALIQAAADVGLIPEAVGREEEWVEETYQRLGPAGGEMELQLEDGRWVRIRSRRTAKGSLVLILTDFTELKRRESRLRDGEARFRDFADAGAERFWEMDAQLRFTYYKSPQDDESGVEGGRLLGKTLRELGAEMGVADERWNAHCADLEAHRPYRDFRFSAPQPDGRIRHFRASGVPVFGDHGTFQGYRGVLTDDTVLVEERLRAERAEAYLRVAVETVPYGFVIRDDHLRLVLCNSKYKEIYGLPEELASPGATFEAALRAGLAEGIYLDAVGREEEWLADRLARQHQPSGPWEQRVRDRWILVEERLLPGGGTVGTRTDITEIKRSAERAIQSERLQALGTLAGGIAHDFNNLLAAMIGYAELVLDEPELGEEARDSLEQVLSAGQKAKDLVRQILRFSRFTDDGAAELCRVSTIAEEVVSILRPAIHPDVKLLLDLRSAEAEVLAIPAHLSQIVMNLTVNAAQAIGQRPGRVEIVVDDVEVDEVFAENHPPLACGPCVRIAVRDDGPGMNDKLLKRIFEPFFTTKQVGEGTGMGLSVVHGIVGKYDGTITVYSELGVGSEFQVYLPRAADGTPGTRDCAPKGQVVAGGAGNALLVDDDAAVRGAAVGLLTRLGYCVVELPDAMSALEALRDQPDSFSLVVTDQVMPNKSGQELATEIRETWPDLPILLCTGYGHGLDEAKLAALGKTALLVKPFTLRELSTTLEGLLGDAAEA